MDFLFFETSSDHQGEVQKIQNEEQPSDDARCGDVLDTDQSNYHKGLEDAGED
jgi:hypothetical protein